MKATRRIPLPASLEPYAGVIFFHRFRTEQEKQLMHDRQTAMRFLAHVVMSTTLTNEDIFPWLGVLSCKTIEEAVVFCEGQGSKIGYSTPAALLKGYMESNGFGIQSQQDFGVTVYTLALFVSSTGLFEYDSLEDIKSLVRRFYTESSEKN